MLLNILSIAYDVSIFECLECGWCLTSFGVRLQALNKSVMMHITSRRNVIFMSIENTAMALFLLLFGFI